MLAPPTQETGVARNSLCIWQGDERIILPKFKFIAAMLRLVLRSATWIVHARDRGWTRQGSASGLETEANRSF